MSRLNNVSSTQIYISERVFMRTYEPYKLILRILYHMLNVYVCVYLYLFVCSCINLPSHLCIVNHHIQNVDEENNSFGPLMYFYCLTKILRIV